METQTIDAEQVNQFIVRLKRGKAPGSDGIYHEHLIFGNSKVLYVSLASISLYNNKIIKYNIYIAPYSQVLYGAVHCYYNY